MPALFGQREQVRLAQLGKMLAGCLRRYAGRVGKLARRQGAPVRQRHQNVGASWIADQGGDFGNGGVSSVHRSQNIGALVGEFQR